MADVLDTFNQICLHSILFHFLNLLRLGLFDNTIELELLRMFWSLVLLSAFKCGVESVTLYLFWCSKSDWSIASIWEKSLDSLFLNTCFSCMLDMAMKDDCSPDAYSFEASLPRLPCFRGDAAPEGFSYSWSWFSSDDVSELNSMLFVSSFGWFCMFEG